MGKKPFGKNRGQGQEQKEFNEEVIQIDRVTRVVKGGRRLRFRATVVLGNKKGKVGIGIGKATEVQGAIKKAVTKAKKSITKINIYQGTIPHRIQNKFKSAKVLLIPACEGTGIIAGGAVRKVVELAGIRNVLSKSIGSSNKINCVKATLEALKKLRFRAEPAKKTQLPAVVPTPIPTPIPTPVPTPVPKPEEQKKIVKKSQPKKETPKTN